MKKISETYNMKQIKNKMLAIFMASPIYSKVFVNFTHSKTKPVML